MMSTDKNGTSLVSQPNGLAVAMDKETEALAAVVIKRFPCKLHDMLVELDAMGLSHIVSFQPHGRAFKIHKIDLFVSYVLPKYVLSSSRSSTILCTGSPYCLLLSRNTSVVKMGTR
jgi:HSF-type DNA-binding